MGVNAPSPLAVLQIPSPSRLLPSACCPDKDLVILISRIGGRDRLCLWNYVHSNKIWEVDVDGGDEGSVTDITALAWSPDGQTIVVVQHPPQISLHSLKDGAKRASLPLKFEISSQTIRIVDVWWFRDERSTQNKSIPDIFRRRGVITGSSHSILRSLPLLDSLQEDTQKITATDLFAFQGSQTKSSYKTSIPAIINEWPSLPPDLLSASIAGPSPGFSKQTSEAETDDLNAYSILAVADDRGYVHYYLEGFYPLGGFSVGSDLFVKWLSKDQKKPVFLAQLATRFEQSTDTVTLLQPITFDLPLLSHRYPRDMAKLSSTARELCWYIIRAISEMHTAWYGTPTLSGAREIGPRWIQTFESKQKEQFGQKEATAILDLTALLVTGRATDSLLDFLGSGDQMSERGIQKWETTVTDALTKIRDYSEKRAAPAFQRLHIVLEELQGWSQLPQYAAFELSLPDIKGCLELASRGIILAGWLAAMARREVCRFREFIQWIRFETVTANAANEVALHPRHDILEVNNYLISGLAASSIDQWFTGPVPQFSLKDLGVPDGCEPLNEVIERARGMAEDGGKLSWRPSRRRDMEHIDKNIDGLMNELAMRCRRIFDRATGATSRSATKSGTSVSAAQLGSGTRVGRTLGPSIAIRERTTISTEMNEVCQYFALALSGIQSNLLCIARVRYAGEALESHAKVETVLLELFNREGPAAGGLDLLEAEFLDEEYMVVVCRDEKTTWIGRIEYQEVKYEEGKYVSTLTREELMEEAVSLWKQGQVSTVTTTVRRSRGLTGSKEGRVSVALNGLKGRRVGCVVDEEGATLESFDFEPSNDEDDEDDEDDDEDDNDDNSKDNVQE